MRALFVYLLAIGIGLAIGYSEIVWLAKSFEKAASRSHYSKDNLESETTHASHDRSSTPAALNPGEAREGEANGVDSSFGQIGTDQSTALAEKTPAGSAAETKGDHQTTGLANHQKNVNASSAFTAPSEPNPLSGSEPGPRMANEWRPYKESDQGRVSKQGSTRNYVKQQRLSELLKHPLELRCITCVFLPSQSRR